MIAIVRLVIAWGIERCGRVSRLLLSFVVCGVGWETRCESRDGQRREDISGGYMYLMSGSVFGSGIEV